MTDLESKYPSLTLFCDIQWDEIQNEFSPIEDQISFPEFLQEKALAGDCPPYIFELAFYEFALDQIQMMKVTSKGQSATALNPTALFLHLEFDVMAMLDLAKSGKVEIISRPHILCLFMNSSNTICSLELSSTDLEFLQLFENDSPTNVHQLDQNKLQFFQHQELLSI